ncbi:HIT family protein [Micromonospora chalcea]|uniref:HIT family protein n=1 Tax=Micromonospora chalcea TaxID=1874 RepID=UPI00292A58EA|nr:HIT family protein [Micromonospora chalcea]
MPAFRVTDEPDGVAFLDTRPVFKGHVLVVPRTHLVALSDLPPDALPGYFRLVQRIAVAVETGLDAGGTFVAMNNRVSQSVPHLHTHVVPRTKGDGLRGFFWPRTRYAGDAEAEAFAGRISAALA